MINRTLYEILLSKLFTGKTILLLGPRQVGKTTLLKLIRQSNSERSIWLNMDNPEDRDLLNNINSTRASQLFPAKSLVVVDEAQRLENAGLTLKIIHDSCPEIQLIATGSSSFELTDKIRESLTGRKWSYVLFPISAKELINHFGTIEMHRSLETQVIYGSYPEVINSSGQEKETLRELVADYLYKDVFRVRDIRKPDLIDKLVKALSYQVGNQVSFNELSQLVQADKETIERYIYLLEESYIIFRLTSFARNLRNELKRSYKFYFVDNGIRNAVINQFNPLSLRNDTGQLWENYMISERRKYIEYNRLYRNVYFWRTTRQHEIDYLEEYDGKLFAYEFKWKPVPNLKPPIQFSQGYPDAFFNVINRDNFDDFI